MNYIITLRNNEFKILLNKSITVKYIIPKGYINAILI